MQYLVHKSNGEEFITHHMTVHVLFESLKGLWKGIDWVKVVK